MYVPLSSLCPEQMSFAGSPVSAEPKEQMTGGKGALTALYTLAGPLQNPKASRQPKLDGGLHINGVLE